MILLWAFLAQTIAIGLIVFVLKKILDRMLIDLAIRHFEYGQSKERHAIESVDVITHRKLKEKYKLRISKIINKYSGEKTKSQYQVKKNILGGMIIKIDGRLIDYSLKDRLRQAIPWLCKAT